MIEKLKSFTFLWVLLAAGMAPGCSSVSNPDTAVNVLSVGGELSQAQADSIASTLSYFPGRTQLSIAMVDDSTAVYYGAVRTGDTLSTIRNAGSLFEIGSLSKVFTCHLLADLALRGKVKLDDPVSGYLNFPLNEGPTFTFKQLANHTSGLPRIPSGFIWESLWNMDNPYKNYDEEKLQDYMKNDMQLENEPGTSFQYSNIGVGILGYTLTQISNKSYEGLLQEIIFQPFNMQSSTTVREDIEKKLVKGLSKRGNQAANWDFGALKGAGAVISSTEDLVRYMRAHFQASNEVLKLQREQTYALSDNRAMALGWFILKQENGAEWYWHNGGTGGYRSSMIFDPKNKKGVIVLSNISSGHSHASGIDELNFTLMETLAGEVKSPIPQE